MKLIIGLGNPGEKYKNNRHNVGFMVVDRLAQELGIKNYELSKKLHSQFTNHKSLVLAKPTVFMNESGKAIKKLVTHYKVKLPDLWVIHDDLDIPLGSYKIQKGKGPREHNGLLSIYEKLNSKDFVHVRVGVDNRSSSPITGHRSPITSRLKGEDYVLQDFTSDEENILDKVIEEICKKLATS